MNLIHLDDLRSSGKAGFIKNAGRADGGAGSGDGGPGVGAGEGKLCGEDVEDRETGEEEVVGGEEVDVEGGSVWSKLSEYGTQS